MEQFNLHSNSKIGTGFTTPAKYFEQLPDQVLRKIHEKPVIPLYRRKYFTLAAAAVLILALLIPIFRQKQTPATLDETTLENYLAYHSGMSQFDLLTEMNSEDIEGLAVELTVEDETIEDILATSPEFEQLIIE